MTARDMMSAVALVVCFILVGIVETATPVLQ